MGDVELVLWRNVRRTIGSDRSCSAEMKNCDFLFGKSISLARGGFVGSVIEMNKGPDDVSVLIEEALALDKLGNYRPALAKFRPALAALQTNGNDADAVDVHLLMIRCHAGLHEVSSRSSSWRGLFQKLTSLSHSTRRCCVSVTSWSR